MFLERIKLQNLLSFGTPGIDLELRPLNLLIGPNGSGKSNLIDAISLLQAAPRDLADPIREGGGIQEWIHKGHQKANANVETIVLSLLGLSSVRHRFSFVEFTNQFELAAETLDVPLKDSKYPLENAGRIYEYRSPATKIWDIKFTGSEGSHRVITSRDGLLSLDDKGLRANQSVLSQIKDPFQYPELTELSEEYQKIRIYRGWTVGRSSSPRLFQRSDDRNDFLLEDCSNLGLVLNSFKLLTEVKEQIRERLLELYPEISDFDVQIQGGGVQVFLQEGKRIIPATRLSDGTLRFLCLLAILCHPNPPPLICIEEPELGLHPDVHVAIGKLLKEASQRTQLIVTTHSDILVDTLSDSPEDVVVCEKVDGQSEFKRLDKNSLDHWLKDYSLGTLWRDGEIGGNRW
jgi:predicted ATPase